MSGVQPYHHHRMPRQHHAAQRVPFVQPMEGGSPSDLPHASRCRSFGLDLIYVFLPAKLSNSNFLAGGKSIGPVITRSGNTWSKGWSIWSFSFFRPNNTRGWRPFCDRTMDRVRFRMGALGLKHPLIAIGDA